MNRNNKKLIIHENEGKIEPDICGKVIDLLNHETSFVEKMSIATIIIEKGGNSQSHYHKKMEEIYYIVQGKGEIIINDFVSKVKKGNAILLPIGSKHQIKNIGNSTLKFISVDSPVFDETDIYF